MYFKFAKCDGSGEQLNAHNNVMKHLLQHYMSCCPGKLILALPKQNYRKCRR